MGAEPDPMRHPPPVAGGETAAEPGAADPWRVPAMLFHGELAVVRLGAAASSLLGWSPTELRVVSGWDLTHPDDRGRLADALAPRSPIAVAPRAPITVAPFAPLCVRMLGRDRRYWWTRWDVRPLGGPGVVAVGVDILHTCGDVAPPVGTWLWDVDADVVSWSPELLDMVDVRVGPPVSCAAFLASVLEDDRQLVHRAIERALATGEPYAVTFRCPTRAGRDRWFHATGRCDPARRAAGARRLGGLVKYLNPPPSRSPVPDPIGSG